MRSCIKCGSLKLVPGYGLCYPCYNAHDAVRRLTAELASVERMLGGDAELLGAAFGILTELQDSVGESNGFGITGHSKFVQVESVLAQALIVAGFAKNDGVMLVAPVGK